MRLRLQIRLQMKCAVHPSDTTQLSLHALWQWQGHPQIFRCRPGAFAETVGESLQARSQFRNQPRKNFLPQENNCATPIESAYSARETRNLIPQRRRAAQSTRV